MGEWLGFAEAEGLRRQTLIIDAYTYWHAVNDDASGGLQLAQMDTAYIAPTTKVDLNNLLP